MVQSVKQLLGSTTQTQKQAGHKGNDVMYKIKWEKLAAMQCQK